jgi:hypothetical protein
MFVKIKKALFNRTKERYLKGMKMVHERERERERERESHMNLLVSDAYNFPFSCIC